MANEKVTLASLDLDISGLIKASAESKQAIEALKKELGKLKEVGKETSKEFKKLQKQLEDLIIIYAIQIEAVKQVKTESKELKGAQEDLNKETKKAIKANENLSESLEDTADSAKDATKGLKNLGSSAKGASKDINKFSDNLDDLDDAAGDADSTIKDLNNALIANKSLMDEDEKSTKNSSKTFDDYKKQVQDSFDKINLLNGGLGGFMSRAQEAGGVMPLLSSGLGGIISGISGMTKASLTFIATPIGAIIAALALAFKAVSSYLTGTQEGMDKLTAITRPLQSIFSALMTVLQNVGKFLVDAFSNPVESIEKFATLIKDNIVNRFTGLLELIPNLGKAIGLLFKGEFSEAAKVAADAAGKVALGTENITDKIADAAAETSEFLTEAYNRGKKIDELQKDLDKSLAGYTKRTSELSIELEKQNTIADDTNKTFEERETAAKKAIDTATAHNKLIADRMQQEIELLRLKYQENGFTDAEKAELANLVAKRNEAIAQHQAGEKSLYDKVDAIQSEHQAKQRERRQKAIDDAIQKNKEEIDLFIAQQGYKEKSLQEQLNFEEQLSKKRLELLEREYKAGKISKTKYETDKLNISQEFLKKQAEATVAEANLELANYLENHKSKITAETELTKEIIAEENKRLEDIKAKKQETLAIELGTNDAIIEAKKAKNQQLSEQDLEYLNQKQALEDEYKATEKANNTALEEQQKAKKEAELNEKITDIENRRTQEQLTFEEDLALQAEKDEVLRAYEIEQAEGNQAAIDEINQKYNNKEKERDKALTDFRLGQAKKAFGEITQLLGENTAAGKAAALASATINTYEGVTQVWAAKSVLPEPAGTIAKAANTAVVVASGLAAAKKIAGTKTPKAEKGALFNIGGQRHSAGGTLFTGADGTQFEAEQGELIGVMNRNAARHFMAFNNAFPAGGASAPNYFANGGIVSRDIASPGVNTDELAVKIAEANRNIPAPVVSVQDIVTEGNSYVQVRQGADF